MASRNLCRALPLLVLVACGPSPAPPADGPNARQAATTVAETAAPQAADRGEARTVASGSPATHDALAAFQGALGRSAGRPMPAGLVPGGDCPTAAPDAAAEMAAQASGRVPLKVGLTLTELWTPNENEEHECLKQVTAVRPESIDVTLDCDRPGSRPSVSRRLCRADLGAASMLLTATGYMKVLDAEGEELPETTVGASWFSLSRRQLAELKRSGSVEHHYVQFDVSLNAVEVESTAVLQNEGATTARIAINGGVVEVPVIRASGKADHWYWGEAETGRVTALVLDDERFPLLVDYAHWIEGYDQPRFRLNAAKISFPESNAEGERAGGAMEMQLAGQGSVDVYGIYFGYDSDRIRKESEPILQEIADMLARNPDWNLGIHGHTDNVGGSAYNLDLSRRRSEAVRTALVDRFGVRAERLSTAGHGLAAPKDTNDTPEGRAHNRRVELVRQ